MFNSSGSMYEEIEQNRMKKLRKRKIMRRRIIVIIVLLILLSYLGILLNDIRRFHKGEFPLITVSKNTKEYDDGRVETYNSIGWVFRYYYRETINTSEMVPFWSPIAMDNVLNRILYDENLPEVEKDYKIPDNPFKRNKVGSVLFFYDDDEKLMGTYKCVLSEKDCELSSSAYFKDDKGSRPSGILMDYIDNRYVFITEFKSKSTSVEEVYVFLYDIVAKHIIAQYQDVRYTYLVEKGDGFVGGTDSFKYIVKKDGYWGIDEVNKGRTSKVVEYEYNLINYDVDSGMYIFSTKQNKWVVYNPNNKVFTSPIDKTIESIHYKDDKAYIVAYEKINDKFKNYYLLDEDGNNLLIKEDVENLVAFDDFLIYAKSDYIYIVKYNGQEAADSIKLYINLDEASSRRRVKPYSIDVIDKTLIINTPKSLDKTHFTDVYYFDLDTLLLKNKRENVKESS